MSPFQLNPHPTFSPVTTGSSPEINKASEVVVIGAGAWGTALASVAAEKQPLNQILLYCHLQVQADEINNSSRNSSCFPDVELASNIIASCDKASLSTADLLIIALPAQRIREVLQGLKAHIKPTAVVLICSKGIENNTLKLMSEVVNEVLPVSPVAVLSGPNFAHEVITKKITVTTIASEAAAVAEAFINALTTSYFRPQYSKDLIGVQVAGAVKNVIAVASGIVHGLQLGENAKAAIITHGIDEICRLIEAMNGDKATILTNAGIGDLILTCGTPTSRNMRLGAMLANGQRFSELKLDYLAEGAATALTTHQLAKKNGLKLPLCEAIYRIIYEDVPAGEEVEKVLRDYPLDL